MLGSAMEHATLEVTARHSAFAFIYALFKPTIEIDERVEKRPWGTSSFEIPPGKHVIAVSYPWLFSPRCGRNTVEVEAVAGEVVRVTYVAPPIRYMPGTITVDERVPAARVVT